VAPGAQQLVARSGGGGRRMSRYLLLDRAGRPHRSDTPGTVGGWRPGRIYGRLDCPSARRALARGHYARHRVFFADADTAVAAGYRPCAVCLPQQYAIWKAQRSCPGAVAAAETFAPSPCSS
jgi:hypothetical protein